MATIDLTKGWQSFTVPNDAEIVVIRPAEINELEITFYKECNDEIT